ncbi:MAG TPA: hydantoinase/oxoprolinase family protein [Candidatus Binataceae bacterium]|nr:hydantoinase/oxoprolinase family protein [Candidatus Binataceae bacterium]
MRKQYFIGVDIGGTFTDVVLAERSSHRLYNAKKLTTPSEPERAVIEAIGDAMGQAGAAPGEIARIVHGTTLATNLIIERKGAKVAYITTKGFGDMLSIGKERRLGEDRFDLFFQKTPPLVERLMVAEIDERINSRGEVLIALDSENAELQIERLARHNPEAVAICLLHSYINPLHERKLANLVRARLPKIYIALSSEVWPEYREFERASTTIASAYVGPMVGDYVRRLEHEIRAAGIAGSFQIMQSNGGVMSAAATAQKAIYSVESGPAAGVIAAAHLGRLVGHPDIVSFDMGGTTAKAGLIRGGKPSITNDFRVGGRVSTGGRSTGAPIKIPVIDLAEVGAGGGSIAWVDSGGVPQVGPHSAGASPGPACYGFGGVEPTVTDANVVLGYLDPAYFLGGKMKIYPEASRDAIAKVAEKLKLDITAAADGIYKIVNTHMGSAVRMVTVQRGIDPRQFAVVAFGGAGPAHIVKVAEQFEIPKVIVPISPGLKSALGLLVSDLIDDRIVTRTMDVDRADTALLNGLFDELEQSAHASLRKDGLADTDIVIQRLVDLRFRHQTHEMPVEVAPGVITLETIKTVEARFRKLYAEAYGVEPDDPAQIVNIRVHAVGHVPQPEITPAPLGDHNPARALKGTRKAYFTQAQEFVETNVFDRALLKYQDSFAGPAIIEEPDSTTICPPGYRIEVDAYLDLVLRKG